MAEVSGFNLPEVLERRQISARSNKSSVGNSQNNGAIPRRNFLKVASAGVAAVTVPDLFSPRSAEATEPVRKPSNIDIDLKPSDYNTLDEYFEAVIDREIAKKTLKSQKEFQIKDLEGKKIDDVPAYKAYRKGILDKAKQFENPNDFESLLNGIHVLKGNNSRKREALSEEDAAYLISYDNYNVALEVVSRLYSTAKYRNDNAALKSMAKELLDNLKSGSYVALKN